MKSVDLHGKRFGNLTALRQLPSRKTSGGISITRWHCICDCGSYANRRTYNLTAGKAKTCNRRDCKYSSQSRRKHLPVSGAALNNLLNLYKRRSRDRGFDWTMPMDAFTKLVGGNCAYCGCAPSLTKTYGASVLQYNGIDRIDSAIGYTAENSQSCCWVCNRMKHVLSHHEFLAHIRNILAHSIGG